MSLTPSCTAHGLLIAPTRNGLPGSVQLLLDRSGQVTVYCGATELGQGSDDVLAALTAAKPKLPVMLDTDGQRPEALRELIGTDRREG